MWVGAEFALIGVAGGRSWESGGLGPLSHHHAAEHTPCCTHSRGKLNTLSAFTSCSQRLPLPSPHIIKQTPRPPFSPPHPLGLSL